LQQGSLPEGAWIAEIRDYERSVLSKRN
jgi:hypothetical protein